MSAVQLTEVESFEYVNLNDVDPTLKPVPAGPYNLRIFKTEIKKGIGKTGKEWTQYRVATQIVDDPTNAGRQIYDGLFLGQKELRFLRRMQDATGVTQSDSEPLPDWFTRLPNEKPVVRAIVGTRDYLNAAGETKTQNTIDFGSITAT